jgi:hypothetical protein
VASPPAPRRDATDDGADRSGCPVSAEALRELESARLRGRKIRRAIGVASFTGWSVGIFAALTLLFGVFSITSLLLGAALAVVAYNELSGAKLLRRLDFRAPYRLGFNQISLCAVVIAYSLWSIYSTLSGPSPYAQVFAADGQVAEILGPIEHLEKLVTLAVYGSLIVASIIFQGGTAWYYFTRSRCLREYVNHTPAWLVDLQRTTSIL